MDLQALVESETQTIIKRERFDYFAFRAAKQRSFMDKLLDTKHQDKNTYAIFTDAENYINASKETPSGRSIRRVSLDSGEIPEADGLTILACTTNDLGKLGPQRIENFVRNSTNVVLAVHDYDNHHWFSMSTIALGLADIYLPAHDYNLQTISRLCHHPVYPVAVGSIQWTKQTLIEHQSAIVDAHRSNQLAGLHIFYPQFDLRNRIIATFSAAIPTVGFVQHDAYRNRPPLERLQAWLSAKIHLICPTTLDVPLRFFDALITGGMPVIPSGLIPTMQTLGISSDFYATYDIQDLLNPLKAQAKWLEIFDLQGKFGIQERFQFAINHFHLDSVLDQAFNLANRIIRQAINSKPYDCY